MEAQGSGKGYSLLLAAGQLMGFSLAEPFHLDQVKKSSLLFCPGQVMCPSGCWQVLFKKFCTILLWYSGLLKSRSGNSQSRLTWKSLERPVSVEDCTKNPISPKMASSACQTPAIKLMVLRFGGPHRRFGQHPKHLQQSTFGQLLQMASQR